jgi:hypothetical protein
MPTQRLFTIPFLCCRLQRPPLHVENALHSLGIEPTLILNETAYFDASAEDAIHDYYDQLQLQRLQREMEQRQRGRA